MLSGSRREAGLSVREVARHLGVGHELVARIERADATAMSIDLVARMAPIVGLELAASLHPGTDPIRDRGHLALLERFRKRLRHYLRWRVEVPIPIAGDPRSADGLIEGDFGSVLVEAETHLADIQAIERKVGAKQRDLGADRAILLVADTRHNRRVIRDHPELTGRFPINTRQCMAHLARGEDPGGDSLVIL